MTTTTHIKEAVCEVFGVEMSELLSARRSRYVARPRQVAMFLCKRHTTLSLPEIGRAFGGRDHTTVIHAVRNIKRLIKVDEDIAEKVSRISGVLKQLDDFSDISVDAAIELFVATLRRQLLNVARRRPEFFDEVWIKKKLREVSQL